MEGISSVNGIGTNSCLLQVDVWAHGVMKDGAVFRYVWPYAESHASHNRGTVLNAVCQPEGFPTLGCQGISVCALTIHISAMMVIGM